MSQTIQRLCCNSLLQHDDRMLISQSLLNPTQGLMDGVSLLLCVYVCVYQFAKKTKKLFN